MSLDKNLSQRLLVEALDHSDHPIEAVSALMSAAATILERACGAEQALDLMTQALDTTGAAMRARRVQ